MRPHHFPHRFPRGHSSAVSTLILISIASLAVLAGCSSGPVGVMAPSAMDATQDVAAVSYGGGCEVASAAEAFPSPIEVTARPNPLEKWRAPRLHVWVDGWKGAQAEGFIFDPEDLPELETPAGDAVTFLWSARPKNGTADIVGYRWALDLLDLTDETPRIGPDDLAHWSAWSATETSATVGPFDASADHIFYVQTRDDLGFVTLVAVRVVPGP